MSSESGGTSEAGGIVRDSLVRDRADHEWFADDRLPRRGGVNDLLTGEWLIGRTSARQRRIVHYWATIVWFTVGLVVWVIFRDALWFVGFMSIYAIWATHLAGWAAETPVEAEGE